MFSRHKKKGEKIKPAKRSGGFTYEIEKKILISWAKKLNPFFTPDRLTVIALIAAFLAGLSYYLTNFSKWWLLGASAFLILNWWADSLDGTVARVRKITRERYGYYIDHILDTISIFVVIFGIGLSPSMNLFWALALIIAYYLVCINTYLTAYTQGKFRLSYGRLGPTEMKIIVITVNIILLCFKYPLSLFKIGTMVFSLFDVVAVVALCFFVYAFFEGLIINLIYLNKIDKKTYKEMTLQEALQKTIFVNSLPKNYKMRQNNSAVSKIK